MIPKLFVMLESTKLEIKKSIKSWWLTKTTSFKKGKGKKGNFKKNGKQVAAQVKNPSLD